MKQLPIKYWISQTLLATEYKNNTYFCFIKKNEAIKVSDEVPRIKLLSVIEILEYKRPGPGSSKDG